MNQRSILAVAALALSGAAAHAETPAFKAGDIAIDSAWARATPKGAETGAAYFTVHNNGATPDKLVGGSADFAAVEIHEMKTDKGVMEMRELRQGLNVPAHGMIRLAPGGYHIMFTHLTKPLARGDKVTATFAFEHAGSVTVEFPVEGLGAAGPAPAMGDMKDMKM